MTPFLLQVQRTPSGGQVAFQYLGQSALRPEGTLILPAGPDADQAALPDAFSIDLAPLLDEVATGLIPDAETLAGADDLMALRDLLGADGPADLCDWLFPFLWRAGAAAFAMAVKRGPGGRAWADPDRRLLRVWFATNRRTQPSGDPVHLFRGKPGTDHR